MRVLLGEDGSLRDTRGAPLERTSLPAAESELAEKLQSNPDQHFFKNPFSAVVRLEDGERIDGFQAHPSTFYPGTPFDTFSAVRSFVDQGKVVLPRMYLYPTSFCNSACTICQFHFRREEPRHIPWDGVRRVLDNFAEYSQEMRAPALILSGDGEPTAYPQLPQLLEFAAERGMRIFLTSNLILPGANSDELIESIARNTTMLTVSIKGLEPNAYNKYQGYLSGDTYLRVLKNIDRLLERMDGLKRREDVLLGVASLILPENTDHYSSALKWFADRQLDYVYLNLVEPSPEHWGISFSDDEQIKTSRLLSTLDNYTSGGMLIRFSRRPFKLAGKSVYYDAALRDQPDVCGSALWNPIVIPDEEDGKMLSCRNSDNFSKPEFCYANSLTNLSFADVLNGSPRERVMEAASKCHSCRLERQVRMFDTLLGMARGTGEQQSFALEFDLGKLVQEHSGGAIAFEDTFTSDPEEEENGRGNE